MRLLLDILEDAGKVAVALAAIVAVFAALYRWTPRALVFVFGPIARPLHQIHQGSQDIAEIKRDQQVMKKWFGPNGGESLGDQIRMGYELAVAADARSIMFIDQLERPIFEFNRAGKCDRISSSFQRNFGYEPGELLGDNWRSLIDPADRIDYMEEWEAAMKERRRFAYATSFMTKLRKRIRVDVVIVPKVSASTGEPVRWFGEITIVQGVPEVR